MEEALVRAAGGRAPSMVIPEVVVRMVVPELYEVYGADPTRPQVEQAEWMIRGTDGKLYLVPSEPGGWLRHTEYHGQIRELKAVSQVEARSICWTVYGDVGRITMEGANLEPRAHTSEDR